MKKSADALSKKYLGKHILVGLTYLDKDSSVRETVQLHGTITMVSKSAVTFKRADNGEDFSIPFNEESLKTAEPEAVYKLKSTGEAVRNVDLLSTWTICPPAKRNLVPSNT